MKRTAKPIGIWTHPWGVVAAYHGRAGYTVVSWVYGRPDAEGRAPLRGREIHGSFRSREAAIAKARTVRRTRSNPRRKFDPVASSLKVARRLKRASSRAYKRGDKAGAKRAKQGARVQRTTAAILKRARARGNPKRTRAARPPGYGFHYGAGVERYSTRAAAIEAATRVSREEHEAIPVYTLRLDGHLGNMLGWARPGGFTRKGVRRNPPSRRRLVRSAAKARAAWSDEPASKVTRGRDPAAGPAPGGVLVDLGELRTVEYRTRKRRDGPKAATYRHAFGEDGGRRPRLAADAAGRLRIIGGDYAIEPRGIVD